MDFGCDGIQLWVSDPGDGCWVMLGVDSFAWEVVLTQSVQVAVSFCGVSFLRAP